MRRLLNTAYRLLDLDLLEDPAASTAWLKGEGFSPEMPLRKRHVTRLIDFRETMRSVAASDSVTNEGIEWLFDETIETAIRFRVIDGVPHVVGAAEDASDRYVDTLTVILGEAVREGSWARFKICANPDCRWAFYDHSKNSSGRWCSMEYCGSRAKISTFRAKNRPSPDS